MRKIGYILLIIYHVFSLSACNSQKKELQNVIEKMQSASITIPYGRMACWASDSVLEVSSWNKAKLKLVHYIDPATCTTCYLQKIKMNDYLFRLEKLSSNEFYNVIIINPEGRTKKDIGNLYLEKMIPQTIFVDTANVFMKANPNIPKESMYHTFLLDENNKVILVGSPITNKKIGDMLVSVVEEKLGKRLNIK